MNDKFINIVDKLFIIAYAFTFIPLYFAIQWVLENNPELEVQIWTMLGFSFFLTVGNAILEDQWHEYCREHF